MRRSPKPDGRGKPNRTNDPEFATNIAAARLFKHLHRAGFVVMEARLAWPHWHGLNQQSNKRPQGSASAASEQLA
jgi:hypothetical protein